MALANLRAPLDEFVKGKSWYWYVPLWLFGLYAFVQLCRFDMLKPMAVVVLIPYSFDFMLHEFAHIFTAFLPAVLTASAGSVSELLLGAGLVFGAFWFKNYFAVLFCCLWADLTLQSAGTYMADAIPQRLPLVSLGGALSGQDPVHDWHFVFGQLHMLGMSAFIGNSLRVIGFCVGLFGLALSGWVMYKMAAANRSTAASPTPIAAPPLSSPSTPGTSRPSSIYPTPTKGALAEHQAEPPAHPSDTRQPR